MSQTIQTNLTSLTLAYAKKYEITSKYSDYTKYPTTYIFANDLVLATDKLQARGLQLHAYNFDVIPNNAVISTAGEPGIRNVAQSDDRANGGNASDFGFSANNVGVGQGFRVDAHGGDGAEGYSGIASGKPGGKGGHGGDGGTVLFWCSNSFMNVKCKAEAIKAITSPNKRQAQTEAWLILAEEFSKPEELVQAVQKIKANYTTMKDEDFATALDQVIQQLDSASESWCNEMQTNINVQGGRGAQGGPGSPSGANGAVGQHGNKHNFWGPWPVRRPTRFFPSPGLFPFHPDQVAMTIRAAENDYFVGSAVSLRAAALTFGMLIDRLSFVESLKPDSPFVAQYAAHEQDLLVLPSAPSDDSSELAMPASIISLKSSLATAQQYADQLASGADFLGHNPSWVPRGSVAFYNKMLEEVLDSFETIEKTYRRYLEIKADQTTRREQLDLATTSTTLTLQQAKDNAQTLLEDMRTSATVIRQLQNMIPARRSALDNELRSVKSKIKNHFNFSFTDFISALGMIMFQPSLGMIGAQAAGLLYSGLNKVSDDSGNEVDKTFLINKIQVLQGDIDDLKEKYEEAANTGILNPDDAGGVKLIGEEDQMRTLISNYHDLLGDKTIREVQRRFDGYVKVVLDRNTRIGQYNVCVINWFTAQEKIAICKATLANLSSEAVAKIDVEIPAITATVERSYFDTTWKVLEMLYRAERALNFWSLSVASSNDSALTPLRQYGSSFLNPSVQQPNAAMASALQATRTSLLALYADAVDNFSSDSSPFGTGEYLPVVVPLTDDDIEALKANEEETAFKIIICLPPCTQDTTKANSPFSGMADVRLTRVRLFLDGAKTTDGVLAIGIEHLGSETVVDMRDETHEFVHDAVNVTFQYEPATGKIHSDGIIADAVRDTYALPGPFAAWQISVSKVSNEELDLSGVTKGWFEFSGIHRSFFVMK